MKYWSHFIWALLLVALLGNYELLKAAPTIKTPPKPGNSGFVLVKDGKSLAPVVVFKDAPPYIKGAAYDLAEYIGKISGVNPSVIEGKPDPIPAHAIWVGFQPVMKKVFPDIDFNFKNPEEILLSVTANHMIIAGRDKWDPKHLSVEGRRKKIEGRQQEYGTANAVYTFLQDCLGVRWLWPGASGEDIIEYKTIAFEPFEYRYYPKFRARAGIFPYSVLGGVGRSEEWCKYQRLLLDSLNVPAGHAFNTWFRRFHETRPELFALQPDGTRSGWPGPLHGNEKKIGRTAKLCQSNPDVWKQWLADVEEQLKNDPNQIAFNASPNDGFQNGTCICKKCTALDNPDGKPCKIFWQETGQEYVSLSDRYITLARRLADMLKKRYPDKDYYVSSHSYGTATCYPPVGNISPENIIVTFVGNAPWASEKDQAERMEIWNAWADKGFDMIFRPNTGSRGGWQQGLPSVMMEDTIKTFNFLGKSSCVGMFVDMTWEHWATHSPQYYLMGKMAWNPTADGHEIIEDYYKRGFGSAARYIKAYWQLFESARTRFVNSDTPNMVFNFDKLYTPRMLAKAEKLLDKATRVVKGNQKYSERIQFIRDGLDYTKLQMDNIQLMNKYLDGGKKDIELADKMRKNWDAINTLVARDPMAINKIFINPKGNRARSMHPDYVTYMKPKKDKRKAVAVKLKPAEKCGWQLAFDADFKQGKLGKEWKAVEGQWEIKDGTLRGCGILVLDKSFAEVDKDVYQRLEFKAATDVEPILTIKGKPKPKAIVCDMSSFTQVKSPEEISNPMFSGYFFQFGGFTNTRNRLIKVGKEVEKEDDPYIKMVAEKLHHVIAENDCGHLRMYVDGQLALDYTDENPVVGAGQDRVGLYFYSAAKVHEFKVYTKEKPAIQTGK